MRRRRAQRANEQAGRPKIRTSSKRMEEFELRGLGKFRVMTSKRKKFKGYLNVTSGWLGASTMMSAASEHDDDGFALVFVRIEMMAAALHGVWREITANTA